MTTYTTIANTAVDAGSPVDEALVTALRDNPIAITEGASGAPLNQKESLESDVCVWEFIEELTALTTGNFYELTNAAIANYNDFRLVFEDFHDSDTASTETFIYMQVRQSSSWVTSSNYKINGASATTYWQIHTATPESTSPSGNGLYGQAIIRVVSGERITGEVVLADANSASQDNNLSTTSSLTGTIDGIRVGRGSLSDFDPAGKLRLFGRKRGS